MLEAQKSMSFKQCSHLGGQIAKMLMSEVAPAVSTAAFQEGFIGDPKDLSRFLKNVKKSFVEMIPCESFHITVDYSQTLSQMIERVDIYCGWPEDVILDFGKSFLYFDRQKKEELDIRVIQFSGRFPTLQFIIERLDDRGLRPATLPELIALHGEHKLREWWNPVTALGCPYVREPKPGALGGTRDIYGYVLGWNDSLSRLELGTVNIDSPTPGLPGFDPLRNKWCLAVVFEPEKRNKIFS